MNQLDSFRVELSGIHLVEASAGTGKTHAITTLYLRAIIERGLLPSQLLVVTFTRAATSEIKNRIRSRLRSAMLALTVGSELTDRALGTYLAALRNPKQAIFRLSRALQSIDDAAIYTIHGFCQRVLEQHAFESRTRFDQTLLESLDDLRDEALNDSLIAELSQCHPVVLRRFLSDGGQLRSATLLRARATRPLLKIVPEPARVSALDETVAEFREAQAQARRDYDFDSLYRLLSNHPGLNRAKVRISTLGPKLASFALLLEPNAEVAPWPERCFLQQSYLETCLKKGHHLPKHRIFLDYDALFALYQKLNAKLTIEQYALELASVTSAAALEAKRKAAYAVQGFDDLLLSLRDALDGTGGITLAGALRERFPFAMIDEFQDTDPIQYSIFSQVYSSDDATLFLIGDPKQSIYAFRGADLHAYISASALREPAKVGGSGPNRHSLEVNWRSDPGLINAINDLYARRSNPFLFTQIAYRRMLARPNAKDSFDTSGNRLSGITLAVVEAESSSAPMDRKTARRNCAKQAAFHVRKWLSRDIAGTPILPKDIAILSRTNDEALSMKDALRDVQVQSALATDTSVFSTSEASHFISMLRALANPNDSSLVASALLIPGFGVSPFDLARRLEEPKLWDVDSENFVRGHDLLLRHGIFAATQHLFEAYDVIARLLQTTDGERRVTNLYHLMELVEVQRAKLDLLPGTLLRLMLKLRQDPTEIATEARQLRIESDEHAVTITTIHRSKGLEYPIVICPFLWSDSSRPLTKNDLLVYHDDESRTWVADLRGKRAPAATIAAAELEHTAETHRLIYVALTRARHAVTVLVPRLKGIESSALGQVLANCWESLDAEPCESIRVERRTETASSTPWGVTSNEPALEWRPLRRSISQQWMTSSFSALIAGQPEHTLSHLDEQGKDVDAQTPELPLDGATSAPARFSAMPPGAESGNVLHKIFETIDFSKFDPNADTIVEPLLARLGTEVEQQSASIRNDIAAVLDAPLLAHDPNFNLRRIDSQHRRSELQFSMGVGLAPGGRVTKKVSSHQLAQVLTPEATGLDASYSQMVERLGFEPLSGYLRGFIDLVFEYEGRTYVVDYKSTSISDRIANFTPELVAEAVTTNHYALQTALYALVMHRYLRWRDANYDYDRNFGGILLVFLRGVCSTQPPGHSVFFHRATETALDALDSVFAKAEDS